MSTIHTVESLTDILSQHGKSLNYSAEFVPFSQSRNKEEKRRTLNWKLRLECSGIVLETDYSQGMGLLPQECTKALHKAGYRNGCHSLASDELEQHFAETGKGGLWVGNLVRIAVKAPLPAPSLVEVLHCLILDSDAIDFPSFESWASEFGYDTDSRNAERIYRACLNTGLKLRAMLGDACMAAIRDFLADY